uniref:Uncharacterized protein n=1 Tax=Arion vulgaris TaxID=1028688 RepID=A0A0B6ZU62_9EUPU
MDPVGKAKRASPALYKFQRHRGEEHKNYDNNRWMPNSSMICDDNGHWSNKCQRHRKTEIHHQQKYKQTKMTQKASPWQQRNITSLTLPVLEMHHHNTQQKNF